MYKNPMKAVEQKERLRLDRFEPRPNVFPDLRVRITVERFDCGEPQTHVFELKKSGRIDRYNTFINGDPWECCGLSGVLVKVRKTIPRILSEE